MGPQRDPGCPVADLFLVKAAPGALLQAARAFPGFYAGYLKLLWKAAQTPSRMAALTVQGLYTGDHNPLKHEIDRIVTPVAQTYEQAAKYKSMLTVLLSDHETHNLLYDFAGRYYEATHPMELAEMGASAVADIVVTVLLAMVTAGVGAAANVAAKSGRLAKAAELLEKIAATIRRVGHRTRLIGKAEDAFTAGKTERRAARAAKKAREVETEARNAERARKIEKQAQKEYDAAKEIDGPKKTPPKSASELYDEIRRSKTDVNDIAKNYNLKPERLQKIKDYVFNNPKFNRNDKSTAEAWLRLAEGKGSAHDKFLLKHETVEMFYNDMRKAKPGLYVNKFGDLSTHDVTNYTGYDWEQGFTKRGPRQEM